MMKLSERMVRAPQSIPRQVRVGAALELMRSIRVRHLPVVGEGKVVGVVNERDLRTAIVLDSTHCPLFAGDVMDAEPLCLPETTPLADAVSQMERSRRDCVLVVDSDQRPVGIFTTTDGLDSLAELLAAREPRARTDHSDLECF